MLKMSIIVPVFGNQETLLFLYNSISKSLTESHPDLRYHFIFVDDGSKDKSFEVLQSLAEKSTNTSVVKLTRNYGQAVAVIAGLAVATSECAAIISADAQEPPDLLARMYKAFQEQEVDAVIGQRVSRDERVGRRFVGWAFSQMIRKLALRSMPIGGFDVMMLSRNVYRNVVKYSEKSPFIQGHVLWPGYKLALVPYHRLARPHGKSAWSLAKKIAYFWDGVLGYSFLPMKIASYSGVFIAILGFLYAAVVAVSKLFLNTMPQGWAPLMIVVLILSGVQLITLGILGEYLSRVYNEVRPRPLYLIERSLRPLRTKGAGLRSRSDDLSHAMTGVVPSDRRKMAEEPPISHSLDTWRTAPS